MPELERELRSLDVEWPETPELAERVRARLEPTRPSRWKSLRRPLAIALVVAVAAVAATLALSPGARSALLELFHLKGVTVELVDELPEVPVRRTLDLGERVTLAEAQRRAGFRLLTSEELGPPDAVYERDGFVTFLYGAREEPRLLLSQFRGFVDELFVKKLGKRATGVRFVPVAGGSGVFMGGKPHFFWFLTADGRRVDDEPYLAGTTLLWERGDLTLRLEAELTQAKAIALAATVG
jgi:hypothetical protein